ncbi:hypothetical protein F0562_032103 [Nyssa sinensis]|uniref:Uncharacterized protein n=1 Tax=Nyssa sinensis TaxID=561372 RepID=A0A5J5AWE0_9ASTE|nr:hypothetical protein F0562_032103 [Nyssa sinensis]
MLPPEVLPLSCSLSLEQKYENMVLVKVQQSSWAMNMPKCALKEIQVRSWVQKKENRRLYSLLIPCTLAATAGVQLTLLVSALRLPRMSKLSRGSFLKGQGQRNAVVTLSSSLSPLLMLVVQLEM